MGKLQKECVERYTKLAKHVADLFNCEKGCYNATLHYAKSAKLNKYGIDIYDINFAITPKFNEILFEHFKSEIEGGEISISISVKKTFGFASHTH